MSDKNNLFVDDMLSQICDDEVLPLGGGMSKEQQRRIEDQVFAALHTEEGFVNKSMKEDETMKNTPITHENFKKRRFKKRMIFVLAAAIIAALGITVGATEGIWNLDLVAFSKVGIENIDALDGSQSEIGATTTATLMDYSKNPEGEEVEVTFTITDSFGDKQQQFIEITTDYPVPDDFDPEKDQIVLKDWKWDVETDLSGGGSGGENIIARDGVLVLQMYMKDSRPLNEAQMTLNFEDLYYCKDAPVDWKGNLCADCSDGELLLEGAWTLNWTNNYEATERISNPEQIVTFGGVDIQIDEVSVSILDIKWTGHAVNGELRQTEMDTIGDDLMVDTAYGEVDPVIISMVDGTMIELDSPSMVGVSVYGEVEYSVSVTGTGSVLEPENVKSITVHGVEILIP